MHVLIKLAITFCALWFALIPMAFASISFRGGRYYAAGQAVWGGAFFAAALCVIARLLLLVWAQ